MQAIILAAGMGKRLGELTSENTKCMIEINGKRLIEYTIDSLIENRIDKVIIVVGYKSNNLKSFLNKKYSDLNITFVENKDYNKTNNIYSLALAKHFLIEDDTILLESDLIFNKEILKKCLNDEFPNMAVVDRFESWMDGTVTILDNDNFISSFISKGDFNWSETRNYFKTVNIYKLSREFSKQKFIPFLDAYIKAKGNDEYYEEVLKLLVFIAPKHLKALKTDGLSWYEIDDKQDLDIATAIFADGKNKLSLFQRRYGGYWRFANLIDFCYLVNSYFPPGRMLDEFISNFKTLLGNYPSGLNVQNLLAAKMFNCDNSEIIVGNGASELIKALLRILEGNIGLPFPTFDEYAQKIDKKRLFCFYPQNNNYSYSVDELTEFSIKKELSTLILINPDNPSGHFMNKEDVICLAEKLSENRVNLVLDESFIDFVDGTTDHSLIYDTSFQKLSNLVIMKSISKSYGVPGLRLGVLISSNSNIISLVRKEISIWNINSFAEYFLQIIGKYKSEYEKACKLVSDERERLYSELCKISWLRVIKSKSNYFLCEVTDKFTASELTARLLNEKWVFIKDLTGKKGLGTSEYIRIAVRDKPDNDYLIQELWKL
jgi:histidinol-phosphate/aromatic aminotransferase/cobyric acid decarboxylase-like protein/GTP:adenosylcobinamide-phosphate guanylyltransferase